MSTSSSCSDFWFSAGPSPKLVTLGRMKSSFLLLSSLYASSSLDSASSMIWICWLEFIEGAESLASFISKDGSSLSIGVTGI
jgi:hypothetical protein